MLPVVLACLLSGLAPGVVQAPPGDGEVRSWKDGITGDSHSSLTLLLRGPKGPLKINFVITTIHRAKARRDAPPDVTFVFYMPLYSGKLDYKAPQVTIVISRNQKGQVTSTANVDGRFGTGLTSVTMPADVDELQRLAKAKAIDGHLFGIEYALTDRQLKAIEVFAERQVRR